MKKFGYFLCAFLFGVIFQIVVTLIYVGIEGLADKSLDIFSALFIFVPSCAIGFLLLKMTDFCNRKSEGIKEKGISRWSMNILFIGFIHLFLLTAISKASKQEGHPLYENYSKEVIVLSIVAVIVAITMYVRNYQTMQSRETRIKKLEQTALIGHKERFHMLVEDVKEDGKVQGQLKGLLQKGEMVHLVGLGEHRVNLTIKKIFENNKVVRSARDCEVVVEFNGLPKNFVVEKYSVVTNIGRIVDNNKVINTENARVLAMIENYKRHVDEKEFISILVYDVCHGKYLLPTRIAPEENVTSDMMDVIHESKDVSFLSVSTNGHEDSPILPIFTDWNTLKQYSEVITDERALALKMTFPQCIQIARKHYDGIVINPFGPTPYFFSNDYLTYVQSLEGYQEDFVKNQE